MLSINDKQTVLKEYFGHSSFRAGQEKIVDCLLSGRDALCIMPTGAGKSICYQVPALIFDGVTIVISPLISLMQDQVNSLIRAGVSAAYLNSSLSAEQYSKAVQNAANGKYKIIYVAPERLITSDFLKLCETIDISMIAIDEAHCISHWGQDFRPSYLKISEFIERVNSRPTVGAFTATATEKVKDDIKRILKLRDPLVITTGFDRPNLFFSVEAPKSKPAKLLELVKERSSKSGIIYCSTRKAVEQVFELLDENGLSVTKYHAGMSETERKNNQNDFEHDRKTLMVATNAFGMGIDKSNVAFVIHYNMPKDIESYYQEAGRAGRDGQDAECILLYSPSDVHTNRFLIEKSEQNPELTAEEQELIRKRDYERLKYMTFYCTTNDCLRRFILQYFGEKTSSYCGKCSNCLTQFETVDITVDAQKILSCIIRTGQRFGKNMIIDILRGSRNERVLRYGLNTQSTYGIMSEYKEKRVRDILDYLFEQGYIAAEGDEYPILKVTAISNAVLRGSASLSMKIARPKTEKSVHAKKASVDSELLTELKNLRKELAARERVPAYIIFTDAALLDMCEKLPRTPDEFLEVKGVGKAKLSRYGSAFLDVINNADNTKAPTEAENAEEPKAR